MQILSNKIWFPPVEDAQSDGLLAMGGDLSSERILFAYQHAFSLGLKEILHFGGAQIQDSFCFRKNY